MPTWGQSANKRLDWIPCHTTGGCSWVWVLPLFCQYLLDTHCFGMCSVSFPLTRIHCTRTVPLVKISTLRCKVVQVSRETRSSALPPKAPPHLLRCKGTEREHESAKDSMESRGQGAHTARCGGVDCDAGWRPVPVLDHLASPHLSSKLLSKETEERVWGESSLPCLYTSWVRWSKLTVSLIQSQ